MKKSLVSAIAAIGSNRELGKDNKLLWNIPEDMNRFRELTKGHPVIMGRKTWKSIGRPLPNRINIIVTRNAEFKAEGAIAVTSVDAAIAHAQQSFGSDEVFIIGGAEIYALALPQTDRLYLTVVEAASDADAFFPDYKQFTKVIQKSNIMTSGGHDFYYATLER